MGVDLRSVFPLVISVAAMIVAAAIVAVVHWTSRRARKRNPLTNDLLRSPGHSLHEEVERLTSELLSDFVCIILGSTFAGLVLAMITRPGTAWIPGIVIALLIAALGWFALRTWTRWKHRTQLQLGLDAELATGQELNQLMLRGCRVFHDFPGHYFNIDHVVIGRAGVFAVETKGRSKPPRGTGRESALVTFDGKALHFPGHQEHGAVEQAKRQAEWLRVWLTSAVGERVDVKPVLAIPGWFVERKRLRPCDGDKPEERRGHSYRSTEWS